MEGHDGWEFMGALRVDDQLVPVWRHADHAPNWHVGGEPWVEIDAAAMQVAAYVVGDDNWVDRDDVPA